MLERNERRGSSRPPSRHLNTEAEIRSLRTSRLSRGNKYFGRARRLVWSFRSGGRVQPSTNKQRQLLGVMTPPAFPHISNDFPNNSTWCARCVMPTSHVFPIFFLPPVLPRQQQCRQRGPAQAAAPGGGPLPAAHPAALEPQRENRAAAGGLRLPLQ